MSLLLFQTWLYLERDDLDQMSIPIAYHKLRQYFTNMSITLRSLRRKLRNTSPPLLDPSYVFGINFVQGWLGVSGAARHDGRRPYSLCQACVPIRRCFCLGPSTVVFRPKRRWEGTRQDVDWQHALQNLHSRKFTPPNFRHSLQPGSGPLSGGEDATSSAEWGSRSPEELLRASCKSKHAACRSKFAIGSCR